MIKAIWLVLVAFSTIPYFACSVATTIRAILMGRNKDLSRIKRLYWECRPLAGPGILVSALNNLMQHNWVGVFIELGIYLIYRWLLPGWDRDMKDDDNDDPWEKRKKKITETIKEIGGRLVSTPVPAPSGA